MLKGQKVLLRAVEPEDAEMLAGWENDVSLWPVSHTLLPFSREVIRRFATSPPDLHADRQVRFMIEEFRMDESVGCIDLFDYEPFHLRAGVGILISTKNRGNGYGKEALSLLTRYAFEILCLRQLYCNIIPDNKSSINLFTGEGFEYAGTKRDWIRTAKGFRDEALYQKLNPDWARS